VKLASGDRTNFGPLFLPTFTLGTRRTQLRKTRRQVISIQRRIYVKLQSPKPGSDAIGYARVSTGQQTKSGSLRRQKKSITFVALTSGFNLIQIFKDAGQSAGVGTLLERKGLQRALREVCKRGGILIVDKMDRLTRSPDDLRDIYTQLSDSGCSLVSVRDGFGVLDPEEWPFYVTIALAEFELFRRTETGRRTAEKRREKNVRQGRTKFGYQLDSDGKTMIPLESEQQVIQRIRQLHEAGNSLRAIAGILNAEKIPTKYGKEWKPQTVKNAL
jgi:DNA invertase Pin-like site-specific DNA recombinase